MFVLLNFIIPWTLEVYLRPRFPCDTASSEIRNFYRFVPQKFARFFLYVNMSSSTNESLDSSQAVLHDLEKEEISPAGSSQGDAHDLEKMDMTPVEPTTDPEKATPSVPKTIGALDWAGPDDPENPQKWAKLVRVYHIIPLALISFAA
jgi:hypothetical protein